MPTSLHARLLSAPPLPSSPAATKPGPHPASPLLGASWTVSPLPVIPVPCPVGTHGAPVAPGGGHVRTFTIGLGGEGGCAREVWRSGSRGPRGCRVAVDEGRSVAPAVVCPCVVSGSGVSSAEAGSRSRGDAAAGRRAPAGLRGMESERESGERRRRWATRGSGVPQPFPSLPRCASSRRPRPLGAVGGPVAAALLLPSSSPGRYPLRRRPAGRRGVRAPTRVTPGGGCSWRKGPCPVVCPDFSGRSGARGLRVRGLRASRAPPTPAASRFPPVPGDL